MKLIKQNILFTNMRTLKIVCCHQLEKFFLYFFLERFIFFYCSLSRRICLYLVLQKNYFKNFVFNFFENFSLIHVNDENNCLTPCGNRVYLIEINLFYGFHFRDNFITFN